MSLAHRVEALGLPLCRDGVTPGTFAEVVARRGLADGNPVVPVTAPALQAMLRGIAEPTRCYGEIPPGMGQLSPLSAAYFATMAGCTPAELPTVLSALAACLSDEFNLLGVLTTTSAAAVTVIKGAPPEEQATPGCGFWPGRRDLVTTGRAVALALRGLGLSSIGLAPMSTLGQPGQFGSCLAEGTHPVGAPLHVRRGFAPNQPCVTVFATSGFVEVEDGAVHQADSIATAFRDAVAHRNADQENRPREELLVLPLEVADTVHAAGWSLTDLEARVTTPEGDGRAPTSVSACAVVAGGVGWKCGWLPGWIGGSRAVTTPVIDLETTEDGQV